MVSSWTTTVARSALYDLSYPRLVTQMVALRGIRSSKVAWLRTVALNVLRNRWRRARVAGRILPKFRGQLSINLGHGPRGPPRRGVRGEPS
ncbi:hypothetical protein AB4Z14_21250 [Terrabacter sp. 2TAF16]|uniref:hypothetical protein n=1 Tax=Terrabacter sp. 2TAF16 TaxID=3233008 RepID=UPI003F9AE503